MIFSHNLNLLVTTSSHVRVVDAWSVYFLYSSSAGVVLARGRFL